MNKTLGIAIAVIVILAIGIGIYASKSSSNKEDAMMEKEKMVDDANKEAMMKDEMLNEDEESMTDNKEDPMMKDESAMMKTGSYETYSAEKIAVASDVHDVVLFFRASWCPTCRTLDGDIKANLGNIPPNLTILDVNYDTANDLKKKHGVTYQHTFVQVDMHGNLVKKWSGSPTLAALVAQVQ